MRRREERRLEHTRFRSKRDMYPFHAASGTPQESGGGEPRQMRAEHVPIVLVMSGTGR